MARQSIPIEPLFLSKQRGFAGDVHQHPYELTQGTANDANFADPQCTHCAEFVSVAWSSCGVLAHLSDCTTSDAE